MVQPQSVPQKKGMSIWAWLAIGCVGILVLGGVVVGGVVWWGANKVKSIAQDFQENPELATVKMMTAANPDLEMVSSDKEKGTVTLRNKKTGEEMTLNLSDIKEGKVSIEAPGQGQTTMDFDKSGKLEVKGPGGEVASFGANNELPAWIPTYAGATAEGVFSADTPEQYGGTFAFSTGDSFEQVFDFFKGRLESDGFELTETKYPGGGILAGETPDGKRNLTFTFATDGGQTKVSGAFSEKKG